MSTSVSTIRNENASEIFALASQSFRENLPSTKKAEFKEYPNAQSMLEDIQIIAENHPVHSSKLTGVVRKIHQFAESLEPYFRIVEIFVQVRPDSMALIWGSLRFIFKV